MVWYGMIWCNIVHFGVALYGFVLLYALVKCCRVLYGMVQALSVSLHPFLACKTGQSWEVSNGEMFAKFGVKTIFLEGGEGEFIQEGFV